MTRKGPIKHRFSIKGLSKAYHRWGARSPGSIGLGNIMTEIEHLKALRNLMIPRRVRFDTHWVRILLEADSGGETA